MPSHFLLLVVRIPLRLLFPLLLQPPMAAVTRLRRGVAMHRRLVQGQGHSAMCAVLPATCSVRIGSHQDIMIINLGQIGQLWTRGRDTAQLTVCHDSFSQKSYLSSTSNPNPAFKAMAAAAKLELVADQVSFFFRPPPGEPLQLHTFGGKKQSSLEHLLQHRCSLPCCSTQVFCPRPQVCSTCG